MRCTNYEPTTKSIAGVLVCQSGELNQRRGRLTGILGLVYAFYVQVVGWLGTPWQAEGG
ncbi:hypothetical protein ACFLVV_02370 [Chloroflexota bacterium]